MGISRTRDIRLKKKVKNSMQVASLLEFEMPKVKTQDSKVKISNDIANRAREDAKISKNKSTQSTVQDRLS